MTAFIRAAREAIWIADAHRGDGKRFIVHADEKLSAFVIQRGDMGRHLIKEAFEAG
jgi:hypothetical protein